MNGLELVVAFLAGVLMGGALDFFVLPLLSTPGSTDDVGMGDERRDDADQRRADVYSSARIGAATALTLVELARPTGVGHALTACRMPIEGRDEWLVAAARLFA